MDLYQIRWNGFYWAGANYKTTKQEHSNQHMKSIGKITK